MVNNTKSAIRMIHLGLMELVDKNSCHKLRNLSVEQLRLYLVEKLLKFSSALNI